MIVDGVDVPDAEVDALRARNPYRETVNRRARERYASDPEYRERRRAHSRAQSTARAERERLSEAFRLRRREQAERWRKAHREQVNRRNRERHASDSEYRERRRDAARRDACANQHRPMKEDTMNQQVWERVKDLGMTISPGDDRRRTVRDHPDKTVLMIVARGYTQDTYEVVADPHGLDDYELAVLANGGEPLDFGFQPSRELGHRFINVIREERQ